MDIMKSNLPLIDVVFNAIDDATGDTIGLRVIDAEMFIECLEKEGYEVVLINKEDNKYLNEVFD